MALGFHNVRFPTNISYGSVGGPQFKTQIFTSHKGYEKRNIDWAQPLMRFNVAYGIRTDEDMMDIFHFFNARRGRAYGFRYKNWLNYSVSAAPIAMGDGESTTLPLWKVYGVAGSYNYKRLKCLVQGSVTGVGLSAPGSLVEGTDFNIDYNAGEIAFNDVIPYGTPVYGSLEFDEPVRFDVDSLTNTIEAYNNNTLTNLQLVGVRGVFSGGSVFSPSAGNTSTDGYTDYTRLILNFDDVASLTTTADESPLGMVITFAGDATLTTSEFWNGYGALSMGTTGRLTASGEPYIVGDSQPFTLEVFAKRPTTGAGSQQIVGVWDESGNDRAWVLRYDAGSGKLQFLVSTNGTDEVSLFSYPWDSIDSGAFDYITIDKQANNWYTLRINGQVLQSKHDESVMNSSSSTLAIGQIVSPGIGDEVYAGLIDSMRITVGRARHTGFSGIEIPEPYTI